PSSQGLELFVCVQPTAGSHESSVHTLPSSQIGGLPPAQAPPVQTSPIVQKLPSSHGFALFVCTQPTAGSQKSSVQGLLSSQLSGPPPVQTTAEPRYGEV